MLVYTGADRQPLSADVLLRCILRTDLAPMPQSVELVVRDDPAFRPRLAQGAEVLVGRDATSFTVLKSGLDEGSGLIAGPRKLAAIHATAVLTSFYAIAKPLQKAVVRYGSSLGEIYRTCGAKVRIDSDFTVPRFCTFTGQEPTFDIARAMQEEAAVLVFKNGKLSFVRLGQIMAQTPVATLPDTTDRSIVSDFKENHEVPFGFSKDDTGAIIHGKAQSGRRAKYWPRSDERILNNLSTALICRKHMDADFSPDILAGDVLTIGTKPMVVITAAHIFDSQATQKTDYSKFWLGEVVS